MPPNLRPKRLLPGTKPRAKITRTKADIDTANSIQGCNPHCLVWVRTYCAKLRKDWKQAHLHSHVHVVETLPIGDEDEYGHHRITVYRIVGTPSQLETVVMHRSVMRYEYVTNSRVPLGEKLDEGGIPYVLKVTAQGAGPEKGPPSRNCTMNVADAEFHRGETLGYEPLGDPGLEEHYSDKRKKPNPPTGSATEYESMREAQKATDHTNLPKLKH